MKPEPLKGIRVSIFTSGEFSGDDYYDNDGKYIKVEDLKERLEGLIKFHEDRIEELIKILEKWNWDEDWYHCNIYLNEIKKEYESIMAIEYWLEDVI